MVRKTDVWYRNVEGTNDIYREAFPLFFFRHYNVRLV